MKSDTIVPGPTPMPTQLAPVQRPTPQIAVRRSMSASSLRRAHARFVGTTPERVLIAPPDLRLADPQIAVEIYHARFPLAGYVVETGGESPFQLEFADYGWLQSLHGFRWQRTLPDIASVERTEDQRAATLRRTWLVSRRGHGGDGAPAGRSAPGRSRGSR